MTDMPTIQGRLNELRARRVRRAIADGSEVTLDLGTAALTGTVVGYSEGPCFLVEDASGHRVMIALDCLRDVFP